MLKFNITQFICALLISCLICSVASAESYWNLALENNSTGKTADDQHSDANNVKDPYKDDMAMGYFMATVPGFIVHGAGNMYLGRMGTGLTLFSLELFSSYILIASALDEYGNDSNKEILIEFGAALVFFGTWLYDILTVDSAVKAKYGKQRVGFSILQPMPRYSQYRNGISLISLSVNF